MFLVGVYEDILSIKGGVFSINNSWYQENTKQEGEDVLLGGSIPPQPNFNHQEYRGKINGYDHRV